MSIRCMTEVWAHSRAKGSLLLLLLAIADHAHDDGAGAFPSVGTLAAKVRMSERQVRRMLRDLETIGELAIGLNEGPAGVNLYRVLTGPYGANGDNLTPVPSVRPPGRGRQAPPDKLTPHTGTPASAPPGHGRQDPPDIATSAEPSVNRQINRQQEPSGEPSADPNRARARDRRRYFPSAGFPGSFCFECGGTHRGNLSECPQAKAAGQ